MARKNVRGREALRFLWQNVVGWTHGPQRRLLCEACARRGERLLKEQRRRKEG
jgi:hypothetical protein